MRINKTTIPLLSFIFIIIAILISLIIFSFILHKNATLIAQTRVQFLEYESAITAYRLEYGENPRFLGSEELIWLNVEGNSELLIKALSGKNPDGTPLSSKDRAFLNPLCKEFYKFSDKDFYHNKDNTIDRTKLADAFNNTQICIIVESVTDNDVVIPKECFPKAVQEYILGEALTKKIAIFTFSSDGKKIIGNWND